MESVHIGFSKDHAMILSAWLKEGWFLSTLERYETVHDDFGVESTIRLYLWKYDSKDKIVRKTISMVD
jgi:hypothetical protein